VDAGSIARTTTEKTAVRVEATIMTNQPECDFCYETVTKRGKVEVMDSMNQAALSFCDWWCLKTWMAENMEHNYD